MSSGFDFEEQSFAELGGAPPRQYAFRCDSPPRQKTRTKGSNRPRTRVRSGSRVTLVGTELHPEEEEALEASLGMAPSELPPHLRCYALQRRKAASFSGPGVLPGEKEAGAVEYKLRLLDPPPPRFQQLVTQLNWRLAEGAGECLYCLGVEDNGHPRGLDDAELDASLAVLRDMAAEVGAAADVLRTPPGSAAGRRCAVVRVHRTTAPAPTYVDLRVAVAGGLDSGKSSLIGVLSYGAEGAPALDNGRGGSRMQVFRHKHEVQTGMTSSISLQHLAYDAEGNVLNYSGLSADSPAELAAGAARMLRLFDLGGHERFSKTALHGLTSVLPDCAVVCVSVATGVSWVTREHVAVAVALGIPLCIALTKADLASEVAAQQVVEEIRALLAAAVQQGRCTVEDAAALAPVVQSEAQAVRVAAQLHRSRVAAPGAGLCVPVFLTSAVTGASVQLLHSFLNALQPAGRGSAAVDSMQGWRGRGTGASAGSAARGEAAHFQIDGSFEVAGVGTVYSGTVVSGSFCVGSELLQGPLEGGSFRRVLVSSIHRSKVPVQSAQQGQHATVAVQAVGGTEGAAKEERPAADAAAAAQLPARADSAAVLHAWMQRHEEEGQQGGAQQAEQRASSAAVDIRSGGAGRARSSPHAASLACSRSAAQLPSEHGQQQQEVQGQEQGVAGSSPGDCLHRWGSSPQLQSAGSAPAPRPRKAAVLLDPALEPQACTDFEAVLVLLGGQWPARGLLSGCYPPEGEVDGFDGVLGTSATAGASLGRSAGAGAADESGGWSASAGSLPRSLSFGKRGSSRRRGGPLLCTPVVHCGSIRQAALVVAMQELPLPATGGQGGSSSGSSGAAGVDSSGGAAAPHSHATAGGEWTSGDLFGRLADLVLDEGDIACTHDCTAGAQGPGEEQADPLCALFSGDLASEPSGSSPCAGHSPRSARAEHAAQAPDLRRLAGAMAAAGVLLPQPGPAGSSPSSTCVDPGTGPSGSSGHTSGGEAPGPAAPQGEAEAARQERQPAADLLRQGWQSGGSDVGCVARVSFRFMHHPEWLVEGAHLIVRTAGRTSGAGYVAAVLPRTGQL